MPYTVVRWFMNAWSIWFVNKSGKFLFLPENSTPMTEAVLPAQTQTAIFSKIVGHIKFTNQGTTVNHC